MIEVSTRRALSEAHLRKLNDEGYHVKHRCLRLLQSVGCAPDQVRA